MHHFANGLVPALGLGFLAMFAAKRQHPLLAGLAALAMLGCLLWLAQHCAKLG